MEKIASAALLLLLTCSCMDKPSVKIAQSREDVLLTDDEMAESARWVATKFKRLEEPPFSFTYGEKPSSEFLPNWDIKQSEKELDDKRTEYTVIYTDPKTGLVARCVAIKYRDFPTVEWVVYFANSGSADTPILQDVRAIDTSYTSSAEAGPVRSTTNTLQNASNGAGEFVLHYNTGDNCSAGSFGLQQSALKLKSKYNFAPVGGRPTNFAFPYFNIEYQDEGVIMAIGWPGQWSAEFALEDRDTIRLRAGQELTHFKLHAGEEVRTPRIALQFWRGDWIRAQNIWRRWMMAHNMPRPDGNLPQPMVLASSGRAYGEMIGANEENQIMHIDRYLEEKLTLDYWWMDAGWYIQEKGWPQVGTWEIDPKRFPRGFKPISDYAHSKGLKTLVWFEAERVTPGTWLYEHHPKWLLGCDGNENKLLNLGNPEAREWLVNHIDKFIHEQGISIYRVDFNFDPLGFWRANDAEDRQGITEAKYVEGFLYYWDELLRRNPHILIDTCASGGRRLDLETVRRAVPLWRSDYAFEPVGHQGMTYGLSFWLPYEGTGTVACRNAPYYGGGWTAVEPYFFWSNATISLGLGIDIRVKNIDYDMLRRLILQWRKIAGYFYGDYYPLTPYSIDSAVWMAWQFNKPEIGEGMVQAFRREASVYESARLKLRGLERDAKYEITDIDTHQSTRISGSELMEEGLPLVINNSPGATNLIYSKMR